MQTFDFFTISLLVRKKKNGYSFCCYELYLYLIQNNIYFFCKKCDARVCDHITYIFSIRHFSQFNGTQKVFDI